MAHKYGKSLDHRANSYPCECGGRHSMVVDGRGGNIGGQSVFRRRRKCPDCNHRITTYEMSEDMLAKSVEAEWRKRLADLMGLLPDGSTRTALQTILTGVQ